MRGALCVFPLISHLFPAYFPLISRLFPIPVCDSATHQAEGARRAARFAAYFPLITRLFHSYFSLINRLFPVYFPFLFVTL